MDSENRPIFQTAPRRCGRTEAMLNRVIESLRGIGFNNPDLSLWRIVCANTEHAKNDIFPRLLKKLDNVEKIKYRWHTDSSERILLEIEPYGPSILILATADLDHRRTAKTFYDHAATEWHLREALWQLKEDNDAVRETFNSAEQEISRTASELRMRAIAEAPNEFLRDLPFISYPKSKEQFGYRATEPMPEYKWIKAPWNK